MRRNVHKNILIILTVILISGLIHNFSGLFNTTVAATVNKSENISEEKINYNTIDMPDFIIEDIFLWPDNEPSKYNFEYSLKNIGDSAIYHFDIEINVKIVWSLFGKIPILTIFASTDIVHIDALLPERNVNITMASCEKLPKFGSYRFTLEVNPNLKIEEKDYDNNKCTEVWSVFFGNWKPLI